MAEPRRPAWLASALLTLAVLALLALAGEGWARWLWHRAAARPAPELPVQWRDLPKVEGLFQLGRPNQRGLAGGVLYETNADGFRGPGRSPTKPEGVFRIVVIGDSVTMGMGVLEKDTYAAALERNPPAPLRGRAVEVLNLGLSGLNTRWIVERLVRKGLRYAPDLVIYGYTLNDIEGPAYRRSVSADFGPLAFADSPLYLWRLVGPRLQSLRELLWAPVGSYVHELDENYFDNEPAWQAVLDGFDRLAALTRERAVCGVVLIHTRLYALGPLHPFERHYAAVADAARERGLYPIASWPRHRGLTAAELWIHPLDPHPNAEGHRLLLEALRAGLADLPASCWETS